VRAKNARALAVPALASFGNTKTDSGTKRRALCQLSGSRPRARCLQRFANRLASAGDPRSEHVATFIVRLTAPGWKTSHQQQLPLSRFSCPWSRTSLRLVGKDSPADKATLSESDFLVWRPSSDPGRVAMSRVL
jgi:hypothetical protein